MSTAIFRRATVVLYLFAILAAGFAVIGSYEPCGSWRRAWLGVGGARLHYLGLRPC